MLTYRPPIEPAKNLLSDAAAVDGAFRYRSIMTRQALCALLRQLSQKNVILPRFVPAGVYHPVIETKKNIIYYDVPHHITVDRDQVLALDLDPADTIFYYIHQFGLFIEQNIELMKQMKTRGYYVIDDRSLSLPVSHYAEFANATAYSFYKLIGLPFGGEVRVKREMVIRDADSAYEHNDALMKRMRKNFLFYSNQALTFVPSFPYRAVNRLFSRRVKFCTLSKAPWSEPLPELPLAVTDKLDRVNFDAVTERRTEIAARYYDGLDPRVRLPLPRECFTSQSAVGFLILVSDTLRMLKYLVRRGIVTSRFVDIWWWDQNEQESDLYKRNLLLPAHQGLSDANVDYIIRTVNKGLLELGEI
jgi:hypothetical protein